MSKFVFFVSLLLFFSCKESTVMIDNDEETMQFVKSITINNNNFSIDIFNEVLAEEDKGTNIFISPVSIYYAMSMAGIGADGTTYVEFRDVLGWGDYKEKLILESIKQLSDELRPSNDSVVFEVANSMWQNEGFVIKQQYKDNIRDYFNGEARELDFTLTEAVDVINSWIEVKTNGKVEDMLKDISSNDVMYLINAVYFKSNWLYKFDKENSSNDIFTLADGTKESTLFMKQNNKYKCFKTDTFTSAILPYIDTNYQMVLFVPTKDRGVNDIVTSLSGGSWGDLMSKYSERRVDVIIPKFKFAYGTVNLNEELKNIGLKEAFTEKADFSKITGEKVYVSKVLHKAFISVDEKGSEAAASTVVGVELTSIEPSFILKADKPFLFFVTHKPTNTILFVGRVSMPVE